MSALWAPRALRIPISLVRSVTVTSMMFITPIPPMSSEMAATTPSSSWNCLAAAFPAASRAAALKTMKSGGSPGFRL